jgi:2-iminoacetate synthase
MTYLNEFNKISWDDIKLDINATTRQQVLIALNKKKPDFNDFLALLSPVASDFLAIMVNKSLEITRKRFGSVMQMFIPLYLSNKCSNICTYCGYSLNNKVPRKSLNIEEIKQEVDAIKKMGFDHILLVTGEAGNIGTDYFAKALEVIKPHFSHISLESQPLAEAEYARLKQLGLDAVFVYQESYNQHCYKSYHLYGKKTNFNYRLETPDRIGKSGVDKIGLGFLIGLSDQWRTEAAIMANHLDYLEKSYWKCRYSISLPRLRPTKANQTSNSYITNKQLLQLICAYRIYNNTVEISLSTRESPELRDFLLPLGVTSISACSKTSPGGYAQNKNDKANLEQFTISDDRSINDIMQSIKKAGLDPVKKDWDYFYTASN